MRQVLFLVVLVLAVLSLGSPGVARSVAAQPEIPETRYGAISGNAFGLFADETGSGVEVVAFGPSGGDAFGVVLMNLTDAPVYGIGALGPITGDAGTATGIVSEETVAPYAVPTGGLAIQWVPLVGEERVGDDATFAADVTYDDAPRADGAPRLPIPFDDISREGATLTAHAFNGYLSPLYAPLAHLVCFDGAGTVTAAAGAVPSDDALQIEPIPVGGDATYEFAIGAGTDCDYFLVGGTGIDDRDEAVDDGSSTIANTPQVPGLERSGGTRPDGANSGSGSGTGSASGTSDSTGPTGAVSGCEVFGSFEEAQTYYAANPGTGGVIDPDGDGLACEVFFGVETATGETGPTSPTNPGPADPAPAPPASGPVYTDFGGLDGIDYDCYDFAGPADAQAYFEADGGSVYNNADALDRNNNGLACEPGEFD